MTTTTVTHTKTLYVAGFLIDPNTRQVALVRKNRPTWQAGKLNAIGGKIEPGETSADAMRREFLEEAGQDISAWKHFATVAGCMYEVHFYRAFGTLEHVRTMESEPIELHNLDNIGDDIIANLSWLLPLAMYTHDIYEPVVAQETYPF
jgi:8-oxo-dGTP diphosphatase